MTSPTSVEPLARMLCRHHLNDRRGHSWWAIVHRLSRTRATDVSWLQLELAGLLHTPVAISYRIDVLVPPEAVATGEPAGA